MTTKTLKKKHKSDRSGKSSFIVQMGVILAHLWNPLFANKKKYTAEHIFAYFSYWVVIHSNEVIYR